MENKTLTAEQKQEMAEIVARLATLTPAQVQFVGGLVTGFQMATASTGNGGAA